MSSPCINLNYIRLFVFCIVYSVLHKSHKKIMWDCNILCTSFVSIYMAFYSFRVYIICRKILLRKFWCSSSSLAGLQKNGISPLILHFASSVILQHKFTSLVPWQICCDVCNSMYLKHMTLFWHILCAWFIGSFSVMPVIIFFILLHKRDRYWLA